MGPRAAHAIVVLGAVLVVATSLVGGDRSPLLLPFIAWALVPYGILWLLTRAAIDPWMIAGAGASAIAVDAGIRLSVFVFPRGSTAAIALVFSPAFITMVCLPLGALGGFLVGRAVRTGRWWLSAPAVALAVAVLALTALQFARPDLFPTTVMARRRTLDRIGPARVVAGGDAFARTPVTSQPSWRFAGHFDDAAGEEVAVVLSDRIEIRDGVDLTPRGSIPLTPASRWNWFSRLERIHGAPVIVDMGGGYQDTQVREIAGEVRWRYRPDPKLAPSGMRPADLDGDGAIELYAATSDAVVRLDANGRDVWTQTATLPWIVAAEPRTALAPPWLVSHEQGRPVAVRTETGARLGEIPVGAGVPLGVADFPAARSLAIRDGAAVRLVALGGATAFEWTIEDMQVTQALSVQLRGAGPPLLAIVGAADRDTKRWRLQLITPDRTVAYDEIRDVPVSLLKAVGADGRETLLLNGESLEVLSRAPIARR